MVKVPTSNFSDSIKEKKIYYFSSTYLNTNIPHYFICIKRNDNDILFLTCCTSKFDTVRKFIETRNLPNESLVFISPKNENNPFDVDTYINCNYVYTYTVEDFENMYELNSINYTGELTDGQYQQILTGIHSSPLVEVETKEEIPISVD